MNPKTIEFAIFLAFGLICLAAGYFSRTRKVMDESWSRPIHLFSVMFLWAPVTFLNFWVVPLDRQVALVMLAQPVLMLVAWLAMVPMARWAGCDRGQTGVLSLGASLTNHGFTMGSYLCFLLLLPAEGALAYGTTFVTSMNVFMVLILYPVARHYGPGDVPSVGRLMLRSLVDLRSMPLYAAIAGGLCNGLGASYPGWVSEYGVIKVLIFLGTGTSYVGIGMRLRLSDSGRYLKMNSAMAAIKFLVLPLATVALIGLIDLAGLGLAELPRRVLLLQSFMPAAINMVIVSNLFHLDARLASALWLWNTVAFCAIPLPLMLWWYGALW